MNRLTRPFHRHRFIGDRQTFIQTLSHGRTQGEQGKQLRRLCSPERLAIDSARDLSILTDLLQRICDRLGEDYPLSRLTRPFN